MSTLFVNNLNTASGSTITVPTGKQIVVTDEGGMRVPGTIIQVVQGLQTTNASITSSTLSDTGISQTITPKSSSSKVLILVNATLGVSGTNGAEVYTQIVRGSTAIRLYQRTIVFHGNDGATYHTGGHYSYCFLDSPSTTSATTYKLQGRTNSGTLRVNDYYSPSGSGASTITLMEIAQ